MNCRLSTDKGPIGVFDSGYGGLTILRAIQDELPEYDYIYLGDNARAPYGTRSFDIVYQFTKQAVIKLFDMGCNLVILACNTASAKALRTIQQYDLPQIDPTKRVLGVIRPTAEIIGKLTKTNHVGILATEGTIRSKSYDIEIRKLWSNIVVSGEACPLWVPIIENNEASGEGADYFVEKRIKNILLSDPLIDTLLLGCTHYPLLLPKIKNYLPNHVRAIAQGEYVANSLRNYFKRHIEMDIRCTKNGTIKYFTTENPIKFKENAQIFLAKDIYVSHIDLE